MKPDCVEEVQYSHDLADIESCKETELFVPLEVDFDLWYIFGNFTKVSESGSYGLYIFVQL